MNMKILVGFLLAICMAGIVYGATSSNLDASLGIQNNAPTIITVTPPATANPVESSTRTIYVIFQANDSDGYANINTSSALVTLSKVGEATRTATGCTNSNNSVNTVTFNCTVLMQFYDGSGAWTINASVRDINNALATNSTQTFTYGTLSAMTVDISAINFGANLNLGQQDVSANDSTIFTNTGNQDFTVLNVKGQSLVGVTTPAETIGASNFESSATNTANTGNALISNTNVAITGASLPKGASSTEELFYFVDVPSVGLSAQAYATTTAWTLSVA